MYSRVASDLGISVVFMPSTESRTWTGRSTMSGEKKRELTER
jgi:hypothetical protein